jgi:hypothetical protein
LRLFAAAYFRCGQSGNGSKQICNKMENFACHLKEICRVWCHGQKIHKVPSVEKAGQSRRKEEARRQEEVTASVFCRRKFS